MRAQVQKVEGKAKVLIRVRGTAPGVTGHVLHFVREGETYGKYTYDELVTIAATKGYIDFPPIKKKEET